MAELHNAAREAVQRVLLHKDKEVLELELHEKERKVDLLSKSNEHLAAQVQQLKAIIKDAHLRYEGDLQRTVSSLQDQYNSALELLQLGAGLAAASQPKADPLAPSQQPSAVSFGSTSNASSAGCCTGVHRPSCSRATQQPSQQQQQQRPACKCPRAAACRCYPRAAQMAWSAKQTQPSRNPADALDSRFSALGLNVEDLAPAAIYGSTVGLVTEPLAALRDVLNLDGSHDREREQQVMRDRLSPAEGSSVGAGAAGPLLAQAQFESRLRNAYRSMLLQLQHRYQLERERQEDAHKLAMQEQEARHEAELREMAAIQDAELDKAARQMERQEAACRAEMQRLEAELVAAKSAADTSRGQAAAARATAEALQAQLQLQRTTHEAELQHVRQGSMPLGEHDEVVRRLKAEWEQALRQRESDYNALLSELAGLRKQLSSVAEPTGSSGNSCHGPSIVSPAAGAVDGQPLPSAAVAATAASRDPHTAASVPDRRVAVEHHYPHQLNEDLRQTREGRETQQLRQEQHQHGNRQSHHCDQHRAYSHDARPQHQWEQQRPDDAVSGVPDVLLVTGSGLRVRLNPGSVPGEEYSSSRPISPAGSAGSAELPPPPSASSSRLSALVDAVVQGSSAARRGPDMRYMEGNSGHMLSTTAVRHADADLDAYAVGGGISSGGEDLCTLGGNIQGHVWQQQQQPQRSQGQQQWHDRGGGAGGSSKARDGGCDGGSGSGGSGNSSSPDHHASEITLGRWQPEAPLAAPSADAARWTAAASHQCLRQGDSLDVTAVAAVTEAAARRACKLSPRTAAARSRREAHATVVVARRRSPSPSPTSSPRRCSGRPSGSTWRKSGNPAAAVVPPRCIRCGLNDATSPGCCRFHPALLSQPGGLRFTPEWMTCQAAGHTAHTPGCFVRSEHFYEPPGLQPQLGAAGAGAPAVAQLRFGEPKPADARTLQPRIAAGDKADAAGGEGDGVSEGPPGLRRDRLSTGGGDEGTTAAAMQLAFGRKAAAAAPMTIDQSVLQRSSVTRPLVAGAARALVSAGGGSGGGSDSPSPKPRTRLPSPMRR